MEEEEKRSESRRSGSPKDRIKSQEPGAKTKGVKAERLKAKGKKTTQFNPGENYSASPMDGPKSEIINSAPDSYRDEHPTSEIKLPTANSQLPTEPMEVHHHPEVEKKGIKEYLLEGLMIFVAVMMGFFAESLREHINEQHQADDYAVNLYNDLKADSAELKEYRVYFKFANANVDTLMDLLSKNEVRQIPSGKLYYFGLFGGAYHVFTPHDATLITLKSSGALRFFGDKTISRKLAVYDELCQNMKVAEEKDNGIYVETRKARAKIFDFRYNEIANDLYHTVLKIRAYSDSGSTPKRYTWASIDSFKKSNPPLLSHDEALFNEYIEMVRSRFLNVKVAASDTLSHHCKELLGLLRKKYSVTDE